MGPHAKDRRMTEESMRTDGQNYLQELASLPPDTFENRFSRISTRLGLGRALRRESLARLFEAAFCAAMCNIAINGLGGCEGQINPSHERNRIRLEQEFMAARDQLYRSRDWRRLAKLKRDSATRVFLTVRVVEENLAGS